MPRWAAERRGLIQAQVPQFWSKTGWFLGTPESVLLCGSGFAGDYLAEGVCSGEEPLVGRVWGLENGGMVLQ